MSLSNGFLFRFITLALVITNIVQGQLSYGAGLAIAFTKFF